MPTYTPNPFAMQGAQANALRSYAPNFFQRQGGGAQTGAMAPHLSVAAADRPYGADVAFLQGYPDAAKNLNLPSTEQLDRYWRFSPHTYEARLGKILGTPQALDLIGQLKNPPVNYDSERAGMRRVEDDEGSVRYVPRGEGG